MYPDALPVTVQLVRRTQQVSGRAADKQVASRGRLRVPRAPPKRSTKVFNLLSRVCARNGCNKPAVKSGAEPEAAAGALRTLDGKNNR